MRDLMPEAVHATRSHLVCFACAIAPDLVAGGALRADAPIMECP
jgi:hypothetical protein